MFEGGRHLAEGTVGVGQVALDPGYIEKLSCLPGKPQSFFEAGDAAFRMVFESLDESQSEVKWYKIPRWQIGYEIFRITSGIRESKAGSLLSSSIFWSP